MNNKFKTIGAYLMIVFDLILLMASISIYMEDHEGIFLFFIGTMLIDLVLTVDYIMQLRRQNKVLQEQEAEETVARIKRDIEDNKSFQHLRNIKDTPAEFDPEELHDLLQDKQKQKDVYKQ